MPYASEAQRRKFHADPRLRRYAAEYDAATPTGTKLPERVTPKRRRKQLARHARRRVLGR